MADVLAIIIHYVFLIGFSIGFYLIRNRKAKDILLKTVAVLCFFMHISIFWVNSLMGKNTVVNPTSSLIWPIAFCNVVMYLLLVVAFLPKESFWFRAIGCFVIFGGFFGTLGNIIGTSDYVATYSNVKGFLSHGLMTLGALMLLVGYIKPRAKDAIYVAMGFLLCGFIGITINLIFMFGIDSSVDAMWFRSGFVKRGGVFTTSWAMGIYIILFSFVFGILNDARYNLGIRKEGATKCQTQQNKHKLEQQKNTKRN